MPSTGLPWPADQATPTSFAAPPTVWAELLCFSTAEFLFRAPHILRKLPLARRLLALLWLRLLGVGICGVVVRVRGACELHRPRKDLLHELRPDMLPAYVRDRQQLQYVCQPRCLALGSLLIGSRERSQRLVRSAAQRGPEVTNVEEQAVKNEVSLQQLEGRMAISFENLLDQLVHHLWQHRHGVDRDLWDACACQAEPQCHGEVRVVVDRNTLGQERQTFFQQWLGLLGMQSVNVQGQPM
mmetsp:Transcript_67241/g.218971  ORF Transcript_67241/g.218971 Transcript_67241/m.218971 type:complete len:241 (-) Transcript_67241:1359-2081(-)